MNNVRFPDIPGVVQDVGKRQGYVGISVRYQWAGDILTAEILYRPDADELKRLNEGGKIKLTLLLGENLITPHRMDVIE